MADRCEALVIVDVLSFSTCFEVAVSQGAAIYPHVFDDVSARQLAREVDAILAESRQSADSSNPFSLSPNSLLAATAGQKIVLPSPNGSALCAAAANSDCRVFAACLRNARAVAEAIKHLPRIGVVAAGEHTHGDHGDLRLALEDRLGAGAVTTCLNRPDPAPAARYAAALLARHQNELSEILRQCESGLELVGMGFGPDVDMAAQLNVSQTVPELIDGRFKNVAGQPK